MLRGLSLRHDGPACSSSTRRPGSATTCGRQSRRCSRPRRPRADLVVDAGWRERRIPPGHDERLRARADHRRGLPADSAGLLARERVRLGDALYHQEYHGEFISPLAPSSMPRSWRRCSAITPRMSPSEPAPLCKDGLPIASCNELSRARRPSSRLTAELFGWLEVSMICRIFRMGWRGWRRRNWEGVEHAGAKLLGGRISSAHAGPNSRSGALGRSSSSPPISFSHGMMPLLARLLEQAVDAAPSRRAPPTSIRLAGEQLVADAAAGDRLQGLRRCRASPRSGRGSAGPSPDLFSIQFQNARP